MKSDRLLAAIALVAGLGIVGCATTETSLTEKGLKPLSEAELKSLYARSRTIKWTNAQNTSGTAEYRPDGSTSVNWGTGGSQGRYRIAGDTFCTQYPDVRGGVERCVRTYRTGENEYRTYLTNGEYAAVFSYTN